MKILGQIVSITPLGLIISLPNQLHGHVPITQISTQFTTLLEHFDAQADDMNVDESDEDKEEQGTPDIFEMFHVGRYVRTVVMDVHPAGVSDINGVTKSRDDLVKTSKRVELSLVPEKVNAGVQKADLRGGFVRITKFSPEFSLNLELDTIRCHQKYRRPWLQSRHRRPRRVWFPLVRGV